MLSAIVGGQGSERLFSGIRNTKGCFLRFFCHRAQDDPLWASVYSSAK